MILPLTKTYRLLSGVPFLVFFLFCGTLSSAQTRNPLFAKADVFLSTKKYEDASLLYQEGLKTNPQDISAQYNCGLALFNAGHKLASFPYFKATYRLNPTHDKFLLKYLGRTYQLNYEFDSAIAVFKEYEEHLHKHDGYNQILEKENIDKRIVECQNAKILIKKPKEVQVRNLGNQVNSRYDDYSPTISADEKLLMFTSSREVPDADGKQFSEKDQRYYEEVLISEWQDSSNTWGPAQSIGDNVNGRRHDASVSVSPDGHRLIVYKSTLQTKGDLYYSHLVDSIWNEPIKFGGDVNSAHFEPSAVINGAENSLIFSSDRPGGLGGLDLYISKLLPSGQWGKAENLGPEINTPYDEDAPFLQPDEKTLHFSSSGHNTMGGYDIFTTVFDSQTKTWSSPENAGHPINTPDDDIYFNWNNTGTRAYFSSIRKGGLGGQDIYMLEFPHNDPPLVIVKGVVSDKITDSPLGTPIKVTVYTLDSNKVVGFYNSIHATGKYIFAVPHDDTYGMQVEAEGYLLHSEKISVPKSGDVVEVAKHIELHPIEKGGSFVLHNILFEYNKSKLQPSSEFALAAVENFLKENPALQMEIGGHTDSIGSYAYNQKLSEARAFAVKTYLEKHGIEKKRLISKGYSFLKPIDTNQTEEGRSENRRTEFLILNKQVTDTKIPSHVIQSIQK